MSLTSPTDGFWFQALHTSRKRFREGTRKRDYAGNEFLYARGVASNVVGAWVVFDASPSGTSTAGEYEPSLLVSTPLAGIVGVSLAANTNGTVNAYNLSVNWSWYQVYGLVATANIATASGDKLPLYQSATPGRATTTAAATDAIMGAWASGASVSNVGAALITYPFVMGSSTL